MRTKMSSPADEPKENDLNDYETQGHLDTIIKAHKIMSDPAVMTKVHALAGRHSKAIKSIGDIKKVYDQKYGSGALKKLGKSAMQPQKPKLGSKLLEGSKAEEAGESKAVEASEGDE